MFQVVKNKLLALFFWDLSELAFHSFNPKQLWRQYFHITHLNDVKSHSEMWTGSGMIHINLRNSICTTDNQIDWNGKKGHFQFGCSLHISVQ